jgi:hypothetical protein
LAGVSWFRVRSSLMNMVMAYRVPQNHVAIGPTQWLLTLQKDHSTWSHLSKIYGKSDKFSLLATDSVPLGLKLSFTKVIIFSSLILVRRYDDVF